MHPVEFVQEWRGVTLTERAAQQHFLDRAFWAACGWPDEEVPEKVEEDAILSRFPALNGERAGS